MASLILRSSFIPVTTMKYLHLFLQTRGIPNKIVNHIELLEAIHLTGEK